VSAAPNLSVAAADGMVEPVVDSRVQGQGLAHRIVRKPLALACLAYLACVVAVAIFAPIFLPHIAGQHTGNLAEVNQLPSGSHLLGTDDAGRDVLDRLLVGTSVTILGTVEALVTVLALGVSVGIAAGFFGGWIDRLVTWLADLTFSIPAIVIIVVVLAVFPGSMLAAMCTLGVLAAPGLMRLVRSATLPVRDELYVAAAQVGGLSRAFILTRHVLPRIMGPIIVQASLLAALALQVQTGLAFLGLLVSPPAPSWGGMIADGASVLLLNAWLIIPPGVALGLTILAVGLLGDLVRDASAETWSSGNSTLISRKRRAKTSVRVAAVDAPQIPAALLAVESLSIGFEGKSGITRVVKDVTFDIRPGETLGIVGESGCGKSITSAATVGLLPPGAVIESGQVWFAGRDLARASEAELRNIRGKHIALISQEPMIGLDPVFRVGSQIAEVIRRHHGVSRAEARQRVLGLLTDVQLPDPEVVARKFPHELSGGMAQRVSIARALAGEPELLIADEPTTALDVTVQAEVLDLLRQIQHARNMAILIITHDWGVIADVCDRAVVMYAGQVVERADIREILKEPLHPYTRALLASNPHNLVGAGRLPVIPGSVPPPGQWPEGCRFRQRCGYATDTCLLGEIPLERPTALRETRCIHFDQLAGDNGRRGANA
jgi:peptide/nickel transport system permease protein